MATRTERSSKRNTYVAAFSNLGTAYNLVNINLAHVVMENEYCGGDNCKDAVTYAGTACIAGTIVGQLTFGYVGDCLGRSCALKLTQVLTILGALMSAFVWAFDKNDPKSVFTALSVVRFVLGVGVGGVYPLAATIAAESSEDTSRGRSVSLVFSMQGIGTLLVPLLGMLFVSIFGSYIDRHAASEQYPGIVWRLLLGVGAIPGIILMFVRTQSPVQSQSAEAPTVTSGPRPRTMTLREALATRAYWPKIFGCAVGWFLFDVTFYGNTLFAPTVLKAVFHEGSASTPLLGPDLDDNLCLQMTILALIGLPGYYVSVLFMDELGRKAIQLQGFIMMTVLYGGLALFLHALQSQAFLLLFIYGLTYFFSNFGPNSTTFVLPSETFPFEVRSSLNGFCAASGKLGAFIGSSGFKPVVNRFGTSVVFSVCAACAVLGALVTVFFVEDRRGRSMEGRSFLAEGSSCDPARA